MGWNGKRREIPKGGFIKFSVLSEKGAQGGRLSLRTALDALLPKDVQAPVEFRADPHRELSHSLRARSHGLGEALK